MLLNENAARKLGIQNGEEVMIYNENGEIYREAVWDKTLPEDTIVINQGGDIQINFLISGKKRKGLNEAEMRGGSPFYEIEVCVKKGGEIKC